MNPTQLASGLGRIADQVPDAPDLPEDLKDQLKEWDRLGQLEAQTAILAKDFAEALVGGRDKVDAPRVIDQAFDLADAFMSKKEKRVGDLVESTKKDREALMEKIKEINEEAAEQRRIEEKARELAAAQVAAAQPAPQPQVVQATVTAPQAGGTIPPPSSPPPLQATHQHAFIQPDPGSVGQLRPAGYATAGDGLPGMPAAPDFEPHSAPGGQLIPANQVGPQGEAPPSALDNPALDTLAQRHGLAPQAAAGPVSVQLSSQEIGYINNAHQSGGQAGLDQAWAQIGAQRGFDPRSVTGGENGVYQVRPL